MRIPRTRVRAGAAVAMSALLAASAFAAMAPAQALLATGVGPTNPAQSGFPTYYTDDSNVALQLCVDGSANCGGATVKSDGAGGPGIAVAPDGEGFYTLATTTLSGPGLDIDVEFAAEAAWLSARTNITFDRVRIRGHSDTAGNIAVDTPYGVFNVVAGPTTDVRNVNFTDDVGCAAGPCNFAAMTKASGHITSWITSATPPAGYLGDAVTSEPALVAGAPATISAGGVTTDEWIVMGKIADPNAVSLPTAVDFGNAKKAVTKSVTMLNNGTAARTLSGVKLTGDKTITQLASSTCTATTVLNVGQRCQVDLKYTPGTLKRSAATLTINDDVAAHTIKVSALSASEITAPQSVKFKPVRSGAVGNTRRVVVTNTGSLPLKISGVSLAGRNASSFDIRSGAPKVCARGASVAPGKQCAAYVRFAPNKFGPKVANLQIRSNALGGVRSVSLQGNAR